MNGHENVKVFVCLNLRFIDFQGGQRDECLNQHLTRSNAGYRSTHFLFNI